MNCRRCKSKRIVKAGYKVLVKGKIQRYKCTECNKYFTDDEKYHRLEQSDINCLLEMYKDYDYQRGDQRLFAEILEVKIRAIQYHLNKKLEK